jgi:H+-translocating NAD(P) transhydrogenase subunit alpha
MTRALARPDPKIQLRQVARGACAGAARGDGLALLTLLFVLLPAPAMAVGGSDVSPFVYQLTVFVIAIFVGYYVVWSVTPALHTPLMSVTNAISSVIVVGALLAVGVPLVETGSGFAKTFGFLALTMAAVNIFGGFLVTQRMLGMYKKREPKR